MGNQEAGGKAYHLGRDSRILENRSLFGYPK